MERIEEKVYCQVCNRKTNHGVIFNHKIHYYNPEDFSWNEENIIAQCLGCDTVNFVQIYSDETMVNFNPHEDIVEYFHEVKVYPPEPIQQGDVYNNHKEKKYKNLPESIQMLYQEVTKAYNGGMYLLSAIGLRMLIEGICKDLSIVDGFVIDRDTGEKRINADGIEIRSQKLIGQINGMIERGVIVQAQSRILHEIRELGNQTAHELTKPRGRTILAGIEIIESILHIIYELDKYSILKK